MSLSYLSVCSGIEAATVAWHPLGWKPWGFSEIEKFPCALLKHHYPDVPNYGDMTKFEEWPDANISILVGGTPCQSFSVAGLRKGLSDPRGNLMLTFGGIARRYRSRWLVWENVPGVLSSNGGRDFGTFLGMLAELGYGFAYRVLDAQYFGVAQRRRRVFVIGYFGDWRPAAAVLFERDSLQGNPAPRRETGKASPTIPSRSSAGGGLGTDFDCDGGLISFHPTQDPISNADGTKHALSCGSGSEQASCAVAIQGSMIGRHNLAGPNGAGYDEGGACFTLTKTDIHAVAFDPAQITSKCNRTRAEHGLPASTINAASQMHVATSMTVRRLTPIECERLQGFPDDYTAIPHRGKPAADGPRYKALGNSMAVPVMRWIGRRISDVDAIMVAA